MAYGITQSIDFEAGSFQGAYCASSSSLNPAGTGMTIEGWFKLESLPSGGYLLVGKGNAALSSDQQLYVYLSTSAGTTKIRWEAWHSNNNVSQLSSTAAFVDAGDVGSWVHFAIAFDRSNNSNSAIYKNGVSVGMTVDLSNTNTFRTNAYPAWIGCAFNLVPLPSGDYFDGRMSLVRWWDVKRTSGEVSTNMCNVLGTTTSLSAEWTLNNTYNDNSGNSNTLTGANTPVFSADVPSVCSPAPTTVKTFDGVTQSTGIKTYMGVDVGNTKSVNGVT